jgi:hypothetical protein
MIVLGWGRRVTGLSHDEDYHLKKLPTRAEIAAALDVDPTAGAVYFLPRQGKGFRHDRFGTRAGWIKRRNRGSAERQIDFRIKGKRIRIPEHWLIWFWAKGRWPIYPKETIDHRDGNPLNNSISNLRLCSPKENWRNSRLRKTNRTGYKWVQRHGDGYSFRMSGYKTAKEAYAAACVAARALHGEFFNGGVGHDDVELSDQEGG